MKKNGNSGVHHDDPENGAERRCFFVPVSICKETEQIDPFAIH